MAPTYEIATYFSEDARRAAARQTYRRRHRFGVPFATYDAGRGPVDACPLGVCLAEDGLLFSDLQPAACDIADAILGPDAPSTPEEWSHLAALAVRFTDDWDHGRITDLAAALGVTSG